MRSDTAFWNSYTMQGIFHVTAPSNNVVTLQGYKGLNLKTVEVSDDNKYTGMIDVAIGIELLSGAKISFHYYINGQYVASLTDDMGIASGKITGAAFLCESDEIGSGFTLDNVVFGFAVPNSETNAAPVKPKED